MKHIYIILSIALLLVVASCTDFLNVSPANVMSISTYSDVRALMGAHLKMYTEGQTPDGYQRYLKGTAIPFYSTEDYLICHFYTDDYEERTYLNSWMGANNSGLLMASLNWDNKDLSEQVWSKHFTNIGFYNMVIFELDKYKESIETSQYQQVRAEAMFLRAWSLFYLVQLYSPYKYNEYGLPFNSNADAVDSYDSSRKTQKQNYDFMIGELKEILSYNFDTDKDYNIFYDKKIISALLAQIYLYKGGSGAGEQSDYVEAEKYARTAMEGKDYALVNRTPMAADEFGLKKNKPYSLLTFMYNEYSWTQNLVGEFAWGEPQYASDSLYALYQNNDKRKEMYFSNEGENPKGIKKYVSDNANYFYNWDFFTAAEMQLIICESLARRGEDAKAKEELAKFDLTRYEGGFTYPNNKALIDIILEERRKEFCFEYLFRWLDLTRIQKGYKHYVIGSQNKWYELKDEDFRFCLPIPLHAELEDNKIPQNPGWGTK